MPAFTATPRFPFGRVIGWCILLAALAAVCSASGRQGAITTNVKLRQGPGTHYPALTGVLAGSPVDILEIRDQWVHLQVRKNHMEFTGWVFHEYVRILPGTKAPAPSPGKSASAPAAAVADKPAAAPQEIPAITASPSAGTAPVSPADTPRVPAAESAGRAPVPAAADLQPAAKESTGTTDHRPTDPPLPPPTVESPPSPPAAEAPPAASGADKDVLILIGLLSLSAIGIAYVAVNLAREHRRKIEAQHLVRQAEEADTQAPGERRKHQRTNYLMEVDFVHAERFYKGMINNISTIGAYIETDAPIDIGDRIDMSYPAPDGDAQIKREADVVRMTSGGVGVAFILPAPSSDD
jgi:hypothetical protein